MGRLSAKAERRFAEQGRRAAFAVERDFPDIVRAGSNVHARIFHISALSCPIISTFACTLPQVLHFISAAGTIVSGKNEPSRTVATKSHTEVYQPECRVFPEMTTGYAMPDSRDGEVRMETCGQDPSSAQSSDGCRRARRIRETSGEA